MRFYYRSFLNWLILCPPYVDVAAGSQLGGPEPKAPERSAA
jgi:hypothetical protein